MPTPTLSNEEILEAIGNKTVVELAELIEAFKAKFNVTIAAPAAAPAAGGGAGGAAPPGGGGPPPPEKPPPPGGAPPPSPGVARRVTGDPRWGHLCCVKVSTR